MVEANTPADKLIEGNNDADTNNNEDPSTISAAASNQ